MKKSFVWRDLLFVGFLFSFALMPLLAADVPDPRLVMHLKSDADKYAIIRLENVDWKNLRPRERGDVILRAQSLILSKSSFGVSFFNFHFEGDSAEFEISFLSDEDYDFWNTTRSVSLNDWPYLKPPSLTAVLGFEGRDASLTPALNLTVGTEHFRRSSLRRWEVQYGDESPAKKAANESADHDTAFDNLRHILVASGLTLDERLLAEMKARFSPSVGSGNNMGILDYHDNPDAGSKRIAKGLSRLSNFRPSDHNDRSEQGRDYRSLLAKTSDPLEVARLHGDLEILADILGNTLNSNAAIARSAQEKLPSDSEVRAWLLMNLKFREIEIEATRMADQIAQALQSEPADLKAKAIALDPKLTSPNADRSLFTSAARDRATKSINPDGNLYSARRAFLRRLQLRGLPGPTADEGSFYFEFLKYRLKGEEPPLEILKTYWEFLVTELKVTDQFLDRLREVFDSSTAEVKAIDHLKEIIASKIEKLKIDSLSSRTSSEAIQALRDVRAFLSGDQILRAFEKHKHLREFPGSRYPTFLPGPISRLIMTADREIRTDPDLPDDWRTKIRENFLEDQDLIQSPYITPEEKERGRIEVDRKLILGFFPQRSAFLLDAAIAGKPLKVRIYLKKISSPSEENTGLLQVTYEIETPDGKRHASTADYHLTLEMKNHLKIRDVASSEGFAALFADDKAHKASSKELIAGFAKAFKWDAESSLKVTQAAWPTVTEIITSLTNGPNLAVVQAAAKLPASSSVQLPVAAPSPVPAAQVETKKIKKKSAKNSKSLTTIEKIEASGFNAERLIRMSEWIWRSKLESDPANEKLNSKRANTIDRLRRLSSVDPIPAAKFGDKLVPSTNLWDALKISNTRAALEELLRVLPLKLEASNQLRTELAERYPLRNVAADGGKTRAVYEVRRPFSGKEFLDKLQSLRTSLEPEALPALLVPEPAPVAAEPAEPIAIPSVEPEAVLPVAQAEASALPAAEVVESPLVIEVPIEASTPEPIAAPEEKPAEKEKLPAPIVQKSMGDLEKALIEKVGFEFVVQWQAQHPQGKILDWIRVKRPQIFDQVIAETHFADCRSRLQALRKAEPSAQQRRASAPKVVSKNPKNQIREAAQ